MNVKKGTIACQGKEYRHYTVKNIVIGSGCAALNAADWLFDLDEKDTVILTDGMERGTSRNAGSDKQTYYKLSLSGEAGDSVEEMAKTLFSGIGVNGDTALCEAACSVKCFMKLANLGVGFPTNRFGEYVGYKTDHDPRSRATSAGPLTSKDMAEALEKNIRAKQIPVLDRMMAVKLVTDRGRIAGVLALDLASPEENGGLTVFECENVVMATGGPSGVYSNVVYPVRHAGMTGMALEAGAKGANLEEWQYGTASVDFRWNVSGTYQQVLPRYVSVDRDGTEREFLSDYIEKDKILLYQFRKGYQWPFTASNVPGSSEVDIAVSEEKAKGRRVYLDFRRNPKEFTSVEALPEEAKNYLLMSGATQQTPVERLRFMNPKAYRLYLDHGIDIEKERLQIAVCAQHCNGGIAVDANWETDIAGLYVCGEAAGTFGVRRPGGSALNSTQVGSMRAAEHIAGKKTETRAPGNAVAEAVGETAGRIGAAFGRDGGKLAKVTELRDRMSLSAAHIRDLDEIRKIEKDALETAKDFFSGCGIRDVSGLETVFRSYDALLTIAAVCSAMRFAGERYSSRGGSRIAGEGRKPEFPEENAVIVTEFGEKPVSCAVPVRPIPERDTWFETVWADYSERRGKKEQ